MAVIIYETESYEIIRACISVHKELGCGFLDASIMKHLLNYLKATGLKLGILINFGTNSLKYKRYVL